MEKMPPLEKIYEALSAIADNRVNIKDNSAKVKSSDFTKEYTVNWTDNVYSSNDNASYWAGYAGYPIIAVLLLQGKLKDYNIELIKALKGINWKALNTKYKNKYERAVTEILSKLNNDESTAIQKEVNQLYSRLRMLDIQTKRSSLKPPK